MTTLALITPIDPGTGTRVNVRLSSSQESQATGAADQVWWPAIATQPVLQMSLFDGDFSSAVEPGSANIEVRLDVLVRSRQFPRVLCYDWAGAKVTLYRLVDGLPVTLAEMKVEQFAVEDYRLALALAIDAEPFQADVLSNTYAGTTGAEGGADLAGRVKPWVFGRARNVEPVFIDQIDNVFQVSGYGPVAAISAIYERGASFGASVGDFASYAALVAADITEGRWGTCLAEGMFRLGAPPAGVITCDVDGDNTGGFLRRTGAVIKEVARRLDLSHAVNAASLDALDEAVPYDINLVLTEQTSLLDLARRLVAPCNAVAGLNFDGRLIAPRVAIGVPEFTLDAQGRQMPPVLGMARQNTSPPYKRIQIGAARSWRVHTLDEIAFFADLVERGLYDAAAIYREGNIVASVDKSRWLYINDTPGSGNAPPTWPTTSNAYWDNLEPPASEDPAVSNASITINGDGEIEGIGTGAGTPVNNGRVVLEGLANARPARGNFVGQLFSATDTGEVSRWNGTSWESTADITSQAARIIEPQFAVIEIRRFELGNVGNRSVSYFAKRGGVAIGGGTWTLPQVLLGDGSATINASTGLMTLSDIDHSGSYTIRYVHTDGVATDLKMNVSFIEQEATVRSINAVPAPVTWFQSATSSRVVTHSAIEGSTSLSGGTWSLVSVGAALTASINTSTGAVTISNATASGTYRVRYEHTDTVQTELVVNLIYYPADDPGRPTDPDYNEP